MKVLCVNDSGRPEDIPLSMWVKKGNAYNVTNAYRDMYGVLLFVLDEIDLAQLGTLYKGFAAYRFAPLDDINELIENLVEEKIEYV